MTDLEPATTVRNCRQMAVDALNSLKAIDVAVLDVRDRTSFTDYMIVASGTSSRHVISIAEAVIEQAKQSPTPPRGIEGQEVGEWILVDLGDVIVHVMMPEIREYYELEKLWRETPVSKPQAQI